MTRLRVLVSRMLDLLVRRRRDTRLDDEIETHLELLADEYVARGLSPADARRHARRAFGGVDRTKAVVREQRGLPLIDTVRQDVRFAARLFQRDRSFAATAVLVLALGIGVNNMLFAILNAHTLRGLPIPRANRVASISTINELNQDRGLSRREFDDLRSAARSFSSLVAMAPMPMIVSGDGRTAERLDGVFASGDVFSITGGAPASGRAFVDADDRPAAPPVAMIGSGAWRSRYGGDPAIVGQSILVDGMPTTVVGILNARSGLPVNAELWLPLSRMPAAQAEKRSERMLTVLGRVRDDVSVEDAATEIQLIGQRLALDHPDTNKNVRTRAIPVNDRYFGRWTHPAWLAFIIAGVMVVVISAANVANLMLARTAQRTRELAVRASIGASPRRLVGQLLIEGSVLAGGGCVLGLGLAFAGTKLFRRAMPEDALPYWVDYSPDLRVLAALLIVSAGTVFVFALLPAIRASRTDVSRVLKDGGRGPGRGNERWTTGFLAAEFALGMVLMAQVTVSFRAQRPPLPSDQLIATDKVLSASVTLSGDRYQTSEQRREFHRLLAERLRSVADISAASLATSPPLMGGSEVGIDIAGKPSGDAASPTVARTVAIGPGYFETLAVPLVRGRDLLERDGTEGNLAVVINQEFARRFLTDVDPIGQRVAMRPAAKSESAQAWRTIVGVSPDIRQRPSSEPEPIVYLAYSSNPIPTATLLVRGQADAAGLTARLKEEVSALDPNLPLYRVRTLADVAWNAQWNGRLSHRLVLTLTSIAVALAAVGLYAVTLHAVGRRTQEIGVRMALGAQPRHVAAMIVRRAFVQLAFAVGAGVICIRLWEGFLPGDPDVSANDPQSLLMVGGVLVVIALAACIVPARRAMRLDPVAAIRHE